jgi:RecA/RadA recombinase
VQGQGQAKLAQLRAELGARVKLADTLEAPQPTLPSGVSALDAALGGGLPRGRLVETTGTGRTSLALQAAAASTRRAMLVAWIEATPAFDAASALRAGVVCARLLLVQAASVHAALRAADVVLAGGGFALVVLDRVGATGRVPESAWARLAHRAEKASTCVLVLAERAEAGTFAHLALRLSRRPVRMGPSLLGRVSACAEIVRAKRRAAAAAAAVELELEPPELIRRSPA